MMQKMNQFLTSVPIFLMETPRMDGLLFLAASVSYHVEELLLYQKSCLSLLFQGDNFFYKEVISYFKALINKHIKKRFLQRHGHNSG